MKAKVIRLEIDIENDFFEGMSAEYKIYDLILTDHPSLLSFKNIEENYKKAIKKLGNFKMITSTLTIYDRGDFMLSSRKIISSFRFTNNCSDEVKMSRFNGDCYNDFQPSSKKEVLKMINELVEKGNQKYIDIVKELQVN